MLEKRYWDTVQRRAEGRWSTLRWRKAACRLKGAFGDGGVCLVPDSLTQVGLRLSGFLFLSQKTSSDAHDNVRASGAEQQELHETLLGFVAGKLWRRLTPRVEKELQQWKKGDVLGVVMFG